ncbi:amino acid ABC transporter permease [Microcoleus sp. FACHB-1515]|uniref:amino acid ABC transporter permease n=1 Tax=Cyanophyceae TaxID=3028117 RepID=UPI0016856D1B|nr:amino acid ABC transporter permease [Microcoleus sp. FACHB-1515]MBD2089989.1 amino acid ABC transporter permease [Microcoleus sp. FACHB-1515]
MTTTFPPASSSPPPAAQVGAIAWVRKNFFGGWFNTLLTLIVGFILLRTAIGFVTWAFNGAQWQVIPVNLPLFFAGRYPVNQRWRLWLIVALVSLLFGLTWGMIARNSSKLFNRPVLIGAAAIAVLAVIEPAPVFYKILIIGAEALVFAGAWLGRGIGRAKPKLAGWLPLVWIVLFFISLWLMLGGLGLRRVQTNLWGGLMLTIFLSVVSIVLSFPFGVLLALGRQSSLPGIRWLSTFFIEVIRGVPLISLLFIGAYLFPLFLPGNARPDLVLRAIVGLTLFTAAYLAETVRGGLQSIPRGQTEAANALGLNAPLTLALVVLPQALKISIPAIVGLFISILQDTTLVSIVGLFDLLGISRSILSNPAFIGRYAEVYLFIGVLYWVLCYSMSWGSRRLEYALNQGQR